MEINDNVQYIATHDFLQTLLSGSLSPDLVTLLDQLDLLSDPGVDQPNYQGTGHPSEQLFLDEHRNRRREITTEARQLEMKNPNARIANRALPYHLIAMALRNSPSGKRRVILTDDEGLMEWMQFFGIETIDSDTFKEKLEMEQAHAEKHHKGHHHHHMGVDDDSLS